MASAGNDSSSKEQTTVVRWNCAMTHFPCLVGGGGGTKIAGASGDLAHGLVLDS
jgi:hypothetical protein